ncbi:FabD/lysophospholipase-like protein [Stemphylium lycopersici]|uniref:FabD/lysophospholipase-like protein n=1 Tax=Stemphylium lycopersici TaxID=183478 RepID=A0A364N8R4_STELY|nr:FabD/lysophospholipase-like protein [Stemphylium lycopersici]RAR13650.1 FabD/lysophospholipase-like protein [Stemphylium lycopersici]
MADLDVLMDETLTLCKTPPVPRRHPYREFYQYRKTSLPATPVMPKPEMEMVGQPMFNFGSSSQTELVPKPLFSRSNSLPSRSSRPSRPPEPFQFNSDIVKSPSPLFSRRNTLPSRVRRATTTERRPSPLSRREDAQPPEPTHFSALTPSTTTSPKEQPPKAPNPTEAHPTPSKATPSKSTPLKATFPTATPSKAIPAKATPSKATPSKAIPMRATPLRASTVTITTPKRPSPLSGKGSVRRPGPTRIAPVEPPSPMVLSPVTSHTSSVTSSPTPSVFSESASFSASAPSTPATSPPSSPATRPRSPSCYFAPAYWTITTSPSPVYIPRQKLRRKDSPRMETLRTLRAKESDACLERIYDQLMTCGIPSAERPLTKRFTIYDEQRLEMKGDTYGVMEHSIIIPRIHEQTSRTQTFKLATLLYHHVESRIRSEIYLQMELSNPERNPNAPLRLLSLDGGGVRGLSSLLVLETLMENIALEEKRLGRRAMGNYDPLKPCDYFDLIGGTSTGGIIAIMLSRLRLDCKQCIAVYSKLAEQIFKHDRSFKAFGMKIPTGASRFSGAVLANTIKTALKDLDFDPNDLMWDEALFEEVEETTDLPSDSIWAGVVPSVTVTESPAATMKSSLGSLESGPPESTSSLKPPSTLYSDSPFSPRPLSRSGTWKLRKRQFVHRKANAKGCRGFVLTSLKNALGLPRILSTYDPNDRTTRIWEALRATSAAPTFFEEMQFGTPKVTYLDGGVGFNNPCAEVDYAAKALWENRSIGVIVSVGTGLQSIPSVKKMASWLPFGLGTDISIASALTGMATSTARVDNEMKRMYSNSDTKYFRFDVDRGLADVSLEQWMKEDEMASLTEQYMNDGQQIRNAKDFGERMAKLSALPPKFEISATHFGIGMSGTRKLDDSFKLVHVDFKTGMPIGAGLPPFDLDPDSDEGILPRMSQFRTSSPTGEGGLAVDDTGRLRKIYPVAEDLNHDGRREEAAVYQCIKSGNVCLRTIKTGIPQGKYKVSFILSFHNSSHTPPRDLVCSVGKPFDVQNFAHRFVDVKVTPDVGSVLLHPDAVRVRVGRRRYEEAKGKGWLEIQGDIEVSVGLDGALGFIISKRFEKGVFVDGWSFGGVRLEPVFGSSGMGSPRSGT